MTRPHTTHHESCGCCEAERDALKAQVDRLCEAINSASHELRLYGDPGPFAKRILDAALASTPAQSLAAHDAEVRAKVLREAAAVAREAQSRYRHDADMAAENDQPLQWSKHDGLAIAAEFIAAAILALAERAPEVER